MKLLFVAPAIAIITFAAAPAAAESFTGCRVVEVHSNNPWEEGLGVTGDPDVDSDSQEVSFTTVGGNPVELRVGQMSWDKDDGDKLTKSTSGGTTTFKVFPKDYDAVISLKVYASQRGVVLYKEEGSSTFAWVANVDCAPTAELMKVDVGGEQVKALSDAQFAALSESIRRNIGFVDLAFELGDGYYDLLENKYFKVLGADGKVIGYLEWAKLHYTEDNNEIEVQVRYDRNGIRQGEIETLN